MYHINNNDDNYGKFLCLVTFFVVDILRAEHFHMINKQQLELVLILIPKMNGNQLVNT